MNKKIDLLRKYLYQFLGLQLYDTIYMDNTPIWLILVLSCLPAGVTGFVVWTIVKKFFDNQEVRMFSETMRTLKKDVLPLRLQAFERLTLLLERMNPASLVSRLKNNASSAYELQQIFVQEVRAEFDHNLTQQVYVSHEIWIQIVNAREQLIKSIHLANNQLPQGASNIDLCRALLENADSESVRSIQIAQMAIKEEVRLLF
ncbi:MAG: hypothetical protein SGJ04_05160 [Bacteroidota bacterium]|nr:hypothetical protein [Bacteroidota bacterium]